MGINDKTNINSTFRVSVLVLLILLLSGCDITNGLLYEKLNDNHDKFSTISTPATNVPENYVADNVDSAICSYDAYGSSHEATSDAYTFFGTWLLEKVAFTRQDLAFVDIPMYSIHPDVTIFLGLEIELSNDFVRLGERVMSHPEYHIRALSKEWTFFNPMTTWKQGYWENPEEMLNHFNDQGIKLGEKNLHSNSRYFDSISIFYPYYTFPVWRGWKLDPELYMDNITFNPLFQNIIILNEEYILVGFDAIILARRISP